MGNPQIKIKRSSVAGKIPTADQLPLGELALNTYDGKVFASKNVGIGTTVFTVNPWTAGVGTNAYNTYFTEGNVGIGNTLPTSTLSVTGTGSFTGIVTALTFSGQVNAGVGTVTDLLGTNLNYSGVGTVGSLNIGATQVISSARQLQNIASLDATTTATIEAAVANAPNTFTDLNITGFSTLNATSVTLLNISGVTTVSGGLNASQGADLARLRVTGITTLGQANITGLSNAGISTLGNTTASTLVVSGFSTLGSVSAANLGLAGITTGLNAPGISTFGDITVSDLFLAGITTGLNASGISTLTSLTGTNANYSGISTISSLVATNVSVSGVTTTDSLKVNSSLDVYASNAVFYNDVTINGNLSIGGTSTIINAQSLVIEDKDIILGFTTSQLPTDTTANHGGIAVASTEGTPLVTFAVTGINTLPPTYKQIMWVRSGTMGAGTTDAWLFNYSVGIGSTLVPNDVRLAVGAVQVTEDGINARVGNLTHVRSTNINASGITSTNSLNIGATQVISSGRQLQNIASLDATTTATIEAAISNAPNTFTDLNVTGVSTLSGGVSATQGIDAARLRVTGITTLGQANITGLSNAGVSTLGNATASTLNVSGVSTLSTISLSAADVTSTTTTTTTTAATAIASISTSTYRSAVFQIQAVQATNYNMTTINVLHDGVETYMTEYGTINQPIGIATYSTDISSGSLRLLAYPASINSTVFRVITTALDL